MRDTYLTQAGIYLIKYFSLVGQQHKQQLPRSITDDLSLFPDLFNAYKRSMQKTHSRDNFLR